MATEQYVEIPLRLDSETAEWMRDLARQAGTDTNTVASIFAVLAIHRAAALAGPITAAKKTSKTTKPVTKAKAKRGARA